MAGVLQEAKKSSCPSTSPLTTQNQNQPPALQRVAQMIAPQKAAKEGSVGQRGGNNIRENMHNAKNNHCVMRKQTGRLRGWAGYIQEGGAEIPLAVSSDILAEKKI